MFALDTVKHGGMIRLRALHGLLIMLMAVFCSAAPAAACGGIMHMTITERAIGLVKDPGLRKMIEENRNTLLWASWYPDSGYAAGNQYGEYSHWMQFLDGYLDYIMNDVGPNDPDYGKLAAHLFGASAHSIEDQVFDHLFLAKTEQVEGAGQSELDTGLDMLCMYDFKGYKLGYPDEVFIDSGRYTPVRHLAKVYKKTGMDYPDIETQISRGQMMLALAVKGEMVFFRLQQTAIRSMYPWSAKNYVSAPGGIKHEARIVAAYWEALWNRLNGRPYDFVIATFPERGGEALSVDHKSVDSNISVFFSRRYDQNTVNRETFVVRDPNGAAIEGRFDWCYGSNMVRFVPARDLERNAVYRVTLTTGITSYDGAPMPQKYEFSYTTP